jgi:hypothetical protein
MTNVTNRNTNIRDRFYMFLLWKEVFIVFLNNGKQAASLSCKHNGNITYKPKQEQLSIFIPQIGS